MNSANSSGRPRAYEVVYVNVSALYIYDTFCGHQIAYLFVWQQNRIAILHAQF